MSGDACPVAVRFSTDDPDLWVEFECELGMHHVGRHQCETEGDDGEPSMVFWGGKRLRLEDDEGEEDD